MVLADIDVGLGVEVVVFQDGQRLPVVDLAGAEQVRRVVEEQHLRAQQHRLGRAARQRGQAQRGLGLGADVVVGEQDLAVAGRRRVAHASREPACPTKIGLLYDVQPLTQNLPCPLEVGLVLGVLIALVDHPDGADAVECGEIVGERGHGVRAVDGAVEGADDDVRRDVPPHLVRRHRVPQVGDRAALVRGVDDDVDGAAVGEAVQRHRQLDVDFRGGGDVRRRRPGVRGLQTQVAADVLGVRADATSPRTRPRMVTSGTVVHRCHWEARGGQYVSVATVVRGPARSPCAAGSPSRRPVRALDREYRSGSIQSAGGAKSTRWTVMPSAAFAVVSGVKSASSLELLTAPGCDRAANRPSDSPAFTRRRSPCAAR